MPQVDKLKKPVDNHSIHNKAGRSAGMILELPYPPSTNTYYRHTVVNGRPRTLISSKGRIYRQQVAKHCMIERWSKGLGIPLTCEIDLYPPDKRKRDADNSLKSLLDAMQHAGVYDDDSQIQVLIIRKHDAEKPGRVMININAYEAPDDHITDADYPPPPTDHSAPAMRARPA